MALESLQKAETRLQLTMPHALLEQPTGLPADTPFSLQSVIELSYQRLDASTQQALGLLATFPGLASSFSEAAALASGISLDALDNLLDSGLLESKGPGRYTLHQTIGDFACWQNTHYKGNKARKSVPSTVVRARLFHQIQENTSQESVLFVDTSQPEILPAFVYDTGTKPAPVH